jgi:hypothetical protein
VPTNTLISDKNALFFCPNIFLIRSVHKCSTYTYCTYKKHTQIGAASTLNQDNVHRGRPGFPAVCFRSPCSSSSSSSSSSFFTTTTTDTASSSSSSAGATVAAAHTVSSSAELSEREESSSSSSSLPLSQQHMNSKDDQEKGQSKSKYTIIEADDNGAQY